MKLKVFLAEISALISASVLSWGIQSASSEITTGCMAV